MHEDAVSELRTIREALVGQAPRAEAIEDGVAQIRTDVTEVKVGVSTLLRHKEVVW
jgi:hypothetical protein